MSNVEEARRKAFKLWVDYDVKANRSVSLVNKLEWQMVKAHGGIEDNTLRYHDNEAFRSMWFDWNEEYENEIVQYARKLGFENGRYSGTTLWFDDRKYGLDIYYDYWTKNAINVDGYFVNTNGSSGTFHRFMLFEESVVKFGLIDELDEKGYIELENLINKCMDYLVSVVDERILRYQELLEYVEDKRENALKSCKEYIYAKLEEK
jgi:hypothetical protein